MFGGDGPGYNGPTMPGRQNLSDVSQDMLGEHPKSKRRKQQKKRYQNAEVKYQVFDLEIPTDRGDLETLMTRCLQEKAQLIEKDRVVTDGIYVVVAWIEFDDDGPVKPKPDKQKEDDGEDDDDKPESPAPPTPWDQAFKEHGGSEPAHGSNIEEIIEAQAEQQKEEERKKEQTYQPEDDEQNEEDID